MVDVVRVVVGAELAETVEGIVQFLDRSGRAQVVATASDREQLSQAIEQLDPDAIVAPVSMLPSGESRPFVALADRVTVGSLRDAMAVGARGFVSWPDERAELLSAVMSVAPSAGPPSGELATSDVIAVGGARGGAGTTFVAAHLADAFARAGRATVVIDADHTLADLRSALSAPDDGHTLGDLVPVVDELTVTHLEDVLTPHPRGFRVLHAPAASDATVDARHVVAAVDVAATMSDVVIVHLPKGVSDVTDAVLPQCRLMLAVLTLDVLAFHSTRRVLERWERFAPVEFVVNRASRAEVAPHDVSRVFGRSPVAIIPEERTVGSMQDRGRLLSARSRSSRILTELAGRLAAGTERAA